MSLWRALWTGFGWPYISLGLLKLFSDALNFAGVALNSLQHSIASLFWSHCYRAACFGNVKGLTL